MATPSTAETATLLRAAGARLPERELRGPDHLAERMLPWFPAGRALIKVPGMRSVVIGALRRKWASALWFEVVRTRYMDEVLLAEVAAGAQQVVLLGAGFDTRAHRLRRHLAGKTVIEVDRPETVRTKQRRVRGFPAADVRYATTDFNDGDLAAALAAGGFEPRARSVVVWSGVTPYLRPSGVTKTLSWLRGQAPGTSIVFDYCRQELIDGTVEIPEATAVMRDVAARGEPWRWGIRQGQVAAFLGGFGLTLVEHLDVSAAQQRYLRRGDGTLQGPVWEFGGFVHARVPAGWSPGDQTGLPPQRHG